MAGEPQRFEGQLLVLIDEDVFSVSDKLCRCLRDQHPDVTFVGAPTGGGSGAPRPCITLQHSGAIVTLCTMRVTGPKGELIEGRGTVPDVPVRRTRAGVIAGTDEVLAAALARVKSTTWSGRFHRGPGWGATPVGEGEAELAVFSATAASRSILSVNCSIAATSAGAVSRGSFRTVVAVLERL